MTIPPYYATPEQIMKDRADYARRNISRGRPVIAMTYDAGILFVAENQSRSLHKISEVYDKIAFAAVGKYNEFENLRVAGVRYADLRGYSYDRSDVTARGLANAYAQTLGAVFTTEPKPLEVELVVAEVGASAAEDHIFRLTYDGSVADEGLCVAMGGDAERIAQGLQRQWRQDMSLAQALSVAVEQLANGSGSSGSSGATIDPSQLEVAILDRHRPRRAFRRLAGSLVERLLAPEDPVTDAPSADDPTPGMHDTLGANDAETTTAAIKTGKDSKKPKPAAKGTSTESPGQAPPAGQTQAADTPSSSGDEQPASESDSESKPATKRGAGKSRRSDK